MIGSTDNWRDRAAEDSDDEIKPLDKGESSFEPFLISGVSSKAGGIDSYS